MQCVQIFNAKHVFAFSLKEFLLAHNGEERTPFAAAVGVDKEFWSIYCFLFFSLRSCRLMQTCIGLPNLLVEALLVVQSLGCLKEASLRPRGEESDISPEVDDVMVVAVVVVVIREAVPRKYVSSEIFSPPSESESESESPVKGTERI